ncbi:hypothetical protein PIB30_099487 [Stylosanthes scabra]|uniref:Cystatin domain-containing protein n=1 Tax=Stylosanthes scabra TaxID=79078 RepID=A0ABU6WWT8_9FABA|nr:hypothetical protein [Stylosanthes scabra]
MTMRSSYLIMLLLVLFLLCFAPPYRASRQGSSSASLMSLTIPLSLDVNDPGAIELANFAVTEHNKRSNENLKLAEILSCKGYGYALGNLYFIKLLAINGTQTNKYGAQVHEFLLPTSFSLESFQLW